MVARVLFPVLTCGGTRSHRHPRHHRVVLANASTTRWCPYTGRPQGIAPPL